MAKRKPQDSELIFALDIGTRSIIGVVGRVVDERFQVLAIEKEEHGKRAMLDGQIEDIAQVAKVARRVTNRLEEKLDCTLERVCVAAAGRALRTEQGSFVMEYPEVTRITNDAISRLESGAVDCWDNLIGAGPHSTCLERDIASRLNRYANDQDITDVWIWYEPTDGNCYDIYIGYA